MLRRLSRLTAPLFAFVWTSAALATPLGVVASFTIPADIARGVGGEAVAVRSLTPPNADLHSLQPTPAMVKALAEADLVVAIHPSLETWLDELEDSGALKRPVLYLAKDILGDAPVHDHKHTHDCGCSHGHGDADPHVWMNPDLVAKMGDTLARRLAQLDPSHAEAHLASSKAYATRMKTLAETISATLAGIPEKRRVLVTQHDNIGRFAKKFALREGGNLLDNASTEAADPSAKRLVAIVKKIRADKIPAIFADNTLSGELPSTVAREAGLPPPVTLFVDALDAPGTPAGTYEGMMRENARRIANALK